MARTVIGSRSKFRSWVKATDRPQGGSPEKQSSSTQASDRSDRRADILTHTIQASPLTTIPQELQDAIASHLACQDLSNLSKTCRCLRNTALPFLFQEIEFKDIHEKVIGSWDSDWWGSESDSSITSSDQHKYKDLSLQKALSTPSSLGNLITMLRFVQMPARCIPLATLLPFTPNLTTLKYDYFLDQFGIRENMNESKRQEYIDAYALSFALSHVADTLTHLEISYTLKWDDVTNGPTMVDGNCSLRAFPRLKTAAVPLCVLIGPCFGLPGPGGATLADVLPASLVEFRVLRDYWADEDDEVQGLWFTPGTDVFIKEFLKGRAWEAKVPKLRKFSIIPGEGQGEDEDDDNKVNLDNAIRGFRQLAEDNGLEWPDYAV